MDILLSSHLNRNQIILCSLQKLFWILRKSTKNFDFDILVERVIKKKRNNDFNFDTLYLFLQNFTKT